jgi:copper ion binding protein
MQFMETTTFTVKGMTCGHCVAAVTQELSALPGVHDVSIDLASGHVAVQSDEALADEAVRAAVDEAGYEVVS